MGKRGESREWRVESSRTYPPAPSLKGWGIRGAEHE